MEQVVKDHLDALEAEHGITIVFAVLAGSRAWNLNRANSDYDVRYVYQRPATDYLTINRKTDTLVQVGDTVESHGWDVRKAFGLLARSNYSAVELFSSEIVLVNDPVLACLPTLLPQFVRKPVVVNALKGLAADAVRHFNDETLSPEERTKQLAEAVRMTLSYSWLETVKVLPPHNVDRLLKDLVLIAELKDGIYKLFDARRKGLEWIDTGLARWVELMFNLSPIRPERKPRARDAEADVSALDKLIHNLILGYSA